jgi:hypothetical protein
MLFRKWVALQFGHLTSNRAEEELGLLLDRLEQVSFSNDPDTRIMRFGPDKNFSIKSCYYALNFGGTSYAGNQEIWNSFTPKKCKIFIWLALHNRFNNKERLAKRGITAGCPFGCQTQEGLYHMLFTWPLTSFLWRKFNVSSLQGQQSV